MSIYTQLIDTVNNISVKEIIVREDKNFIKDNLIFLQQFADSKEIKMMNPMIKSLGKKRLMKKDKQLILQNKKIIVQTINKYEEKYNDESNDDVIDENKSIDDIEKELDAKIDKYKGFSKTHPMQGITFDKTKNKYQIRHDKMNTSSINIDIACNKIKEFYDDKKGKKIILNAVKKYFSYRNHYFLTYWIDNLPHFDIQHVISVLNLSESYVHDKYKQFAEYVSNHMWYKNEFGGYILRDLISESIVFEIILSSNSDISKTFKKDVAIILSNLRKEGDLVITNDVVTVTKKLKKHANIDEDKNVQIQNMIDTKKPLSYDNAADMMQLYILINQLSYAPIGSYINQSVLYAFIVTLKREHNDVIVKFGWTLDLLERIKDLKDEYGSNFYLIGLRRIKNELVERKYHKVIQFKFPDNIEAVKIKGKDKIEIYKFNLLMMSEFNVVEEDRMQNIQDVILTDGQKLLIESIRNQHIVFQNIMMSQINLNNIIAKTSDKDVVNNCAMIHYQFLTTQSAAHEQTIKILQSDKLIQKTKLKEVEMQINKEIKLKEMEISKEIRLKELEINKEIRLKELENHKHSKK